MPQNWNGILYATAKVYDLMCKACDASKRICILWGLPLQLSRPVFQPGGMPKQVLEAAKVHTHKHTHTR